MSKQFTRFSASPIVSQTLAEILISSSSATGSGLLIGSIEGAIFTTSIAMINGSELTPSSSVTERVARCISDVV